MLVTPYLLKNSFEAGSDAVLEDLLSLFLVEVDRQGRAVGGRQLLENMQDDDFGIVPDGGVHRVAEYEG